MDLFSGIGGFSLGLKRTGGFRTVAYCEIEPYCQAVLLARMRDGWLDSAPIHSDITKLDGLPWRGRIDVITGGFPCQDISITGSGRGLDGERSGLWKEMERVIRQVQPNYVIVENVDALLFRGLDSILGHLAHMGFDAEWRVFSSCVFGRPHCRERLWLVANAGRNGTQGQFWNGGLFGFDRSGWEASSEAVRNWRGSWVAHAFGDSEDSAILRGKHDGIPSRLDRIATLGNAIVPQIAEWIGNRILESSPPHRGRRKGK